MQWNDDSNDDDTYDDDDDTDDDISVMKTMTMRISHFEIHYQALDHRL